MLSTLKLFVRGVLEKNLELRKKEGTGSEPKGPDTDIVRLARE